MKGKEVDVDEVKRIAKAVAQRYANRCWWADKDDMQSEATVAILAARGTWDPQVGVPFDGYAARAAALRVKDYLWRQSSPVTGGLHDPRKHIAGVHGAELEVDVEYAQPLGKDPAVELDEIDWRLRVRRQLRSIAGRSKDGELAHEVLVRGRQSSEVRAETGGNVNSAVHLVRRKVANDSRLYALWRQKVPPVPKRFVDPLIITMAERVVMRSIHEVLRARAEAAVGLRSEVV